MNLFANHILKNRDYVLRNFQTLRRVIYNFNLHSYIYIHYAIVIILFYHFKQTQKILIVILHKYISHTYRYVPFDCAASFATNSKAFDLPQSTAFR